MNDFKNKGGYQGGRDNRGAFPPRGGNYNRPSFGGGDRGGFNRDRSAGAGSFGRSTELFDAVCATCGKTCQVPFKPNGKKPVYCKDCFTRTEGGAESGSRPSREFSVTPKTPYIKPAPAVADKRIDDLKVQLDNVTYKLEKLIKMIEGSATPAVTVAPKAQAVQPKAEAPKAVVAKAPAKAVKAEKPAPKKAATKKSSPKKK